MNRLRWLLGRPLATPPARLIVVPGYQQAYRPSVAERFVDAKLRDIIRQATIDAGEMRSLARRLESQL